MNRKNIGTFQDFYKANKEVVPFESNKVMPFDKHSNMIFEEESSPNKSKKTEIIKAFTSLSDHPKAEDLKSEVGSAFDEMDLDEDLKGVFEFIGEHGMIYCAFEHSYWVRHKRKLIRVM